MAVNCGCEERTVRHPAVRDSRGLLVRQPDLALESLSHSELARHGPAISIKSLGCVSRDPSRSSRWVGRQPAPPAHTHLAP